MMEYGYRPKPNKQAGKSIVTLAHFSEPRPELLNGSASSFTRSHDNSSSLGYLSFKNTYHVAEARKFNAKVIRDIISEELEHHLKDQVYCPKTSPQLAVTISDTIKQKVRKVLNSRYRIVTSVFISNEQKQGLKVASKALMAYTTDTFESFSWSNPTMHAVAMVFVVYLE